MLPRGTEKRKQMKIHQTRTMLIPEIMPLRDKSVCHVDSDGAKLISEVFITVYTFHFRSTLLRYSERLWPTQKWKKYKCSCLKREYRDCRGLNVVMGSLHFIRKHIDLRKYLISWVNPQNQYKFRPKSLVLLFRWQGIRWTTGDVANTLFHEQREGVKIKMDVRDEKTEN